MKHTSLARFAVGAAALAAGLVAAAPEAGAQWVRQSEQFYLPASHNWVFRKEYRAADRLFNAFDYGHAILYEELYRYPDAPAERLEQKEYDFITRRLLVKPPRVPLEEAAIEKEYVKLAPEAKLMFEWAHVLHRQIYDVLADERLTQEQKDAEVAAVVRYYKTRPDLAFSSRPKSMELMEGHYYSTAFREKYPKFNGLIWAYHWLQVGLYEPLLVGRNVDERQRGVLAAVTRFWQMLEDAPTHMPRIMPMTPAVAPEFTRRYPEAAIIFDNLHSMHDVISDILASPKVPRDRKRAEILKAAALFRDDTSYVLTVDEWRDMSRMMGINNMGGPVTGFLAAFPEPTVERGAVMAGMDHGAMGHGEAQPAGDAHAGHGALRPGAPQDTAGHALHDVTMPDAHGSAMHELHMRMLEDPVIRERILADSAMHGAMMRMLEAMPEEHREHMKEMMHPAPAARPAPAHDHAPAARPAPARRAAPARRPAAKKPDPHAGHARPASRPAAKPAAKTAPKPAAGKSTRPAAKPAPKPNPHAGHGKAPAAKRDTASHRHHDR